MSRVEPLDWVRFRELVSGVAVLTREEKHQMLILRQGGCIAADAEFAVDHWYAARTIKEDWPWLRAAILARAGERLALTEDARRAEREAREG